LAVTLKTGKTIRAKLMGGDPRKDVAVLKLEDIKPLKSLLNGHALVLADIATLEVGQTAIAIGNPFGLSQTLTEGVVSAMNREIPGFGGVSITGMIQTDASINPGNSGGPLLDSQGQLLGMNTMIYSRSGSFSGIGFAIPTNTIKRIVDQMIQYGKVIQPGIGIIPVPDVIAAQARIRGVVIARVIRGTPAARAGLTGVERTMRGQYRLGDVIIAVDGKKVKNFNDLYKIVDKKKIGDTVQLTIIRGDKTVEKTVKTINVSQ
jgi:S1-C subfamily serine protease